MAIEFRITRGARAGAGERFDKAIVAIGRHPINDLRFDAERDLEVSSRHAEVRIVESRYLLVDLGSTNGTFVNGERVSGERALCDGDIITFGEDGPQAEFMLAAGLNPPATARAMPSAPEADAQRKQARSDTHARIAMAVEKQTSSLKRMATVFGAVIIVGAIAAVWVTRANAEKTRQGLATQLAALLAVNDSLSRTLQSKLEQTGIADASLAAARNEADRLASELRAQQRRGGDVSAYAARIRESQTRAASIAGMDYAAIAAANQAALVFLVVEFPDSARSTGTGFNILESGLIVTNRHVVQSSDGVRAQRIAAAFDGTSGEWRRATVEIVSETDELAFLRVTTPGPYPVVAGIARAGNGARVGAPVAILGYPLGTGTAGMQGSLNTLRPSASLSVGTIGKLVPETLQLDAFAAQGSSGSPVFDQRGFVVGVIYGGVDESGGRIVYAVPAARLASQIPTDARGILR